MLEHPLVQIVLLSVAILSVTFLVGLFLDYLKKKFSAQGRFWQLSLVSTLHRPLLYLAWFLVVVFSLDILCNSFAETRCFDPHFFAEIGVIIACGWFLLRWKSQWIHEMKGLSIDHKGGWTPIQLDLINKLATLFTLLMILILLLEATGRGFQALLAFSGIGGLVLAFASQQVVSNYFGGMMIYLTRPFTIGEWILLPEKKLEGYVEEIGWYMTRMRNMEKRPVYIPNSIFTQTYVVTPSRMSHQVIKEKLGLRHEDLSKVPEIVQDIQKFLSHNPRIDQKQKIKVFLAQIGLNSVDIEINAHVSSKLQNEFDYVKQEVLIEAARVIYDHGAKLVNWMPLGG